MFDIKWIREHLDAFDAGLAKRGLEPQAARLIALDDKRRAHVASLQEAQNRRNTASKEIGKAMGAGDTATADALKAEVAELKGFIQGGEETERDLTADLNGALASIANLPLDDVPEGADETANEEVRRWGEPGTFDFAAKEHFEIGEALGLMDFEAAARMSGARFVALKGPLARLERAIAMFMIDLQTVENGYTEVRPPFLVRDEALFGTGQLPKFADDLFRTTGDHWLIPTAEVPLTNLVRERTLNAADLPIRVTAWTPCFRSEAGSAGRDTRGMIRQHQFDKVELVSITTPEQSLRGTGAHDSVRGRRSATARTALSHDGPRHRRHGFRCAQDL